MAKEKIEVIAYSGYRGEETPRVFKLRGTKVEVGEILSRWVEEGVGDRTTSRRFKLKGTDGIVYSLVHDEDTGQWFCEAKRNTI